MDHEKDVFEKPDMSEFWKDHRPKGADATAMRKANFSLGRDEVDYTTHTRGNFSQPDSKHYKNAVEDSSKGSGRQEKLRATNWQLGHGKTDWSTTHKDDFKDED